VCRGGDIFEIKAVRMEFPADVNIIVGFPGAFIERNG